MEQSISVSVTSKQAHTADNPITVQARLSEMMVSYPSPVIISADVKKGYMVVVGVTVEATISRSGMSPMTLMLLDNGIGMPTIEGFIYTVSVCELLMFVCSSRYVSWRWNIHGLFH